MIKEVEKLQQQVRAFAAMGRRVAFKTSGSSHTTRSKSYNKEGIPLDLTALNRVLKIDLEKRTALVQPRVTMEQLVRATLACGFIPPVIPEFKKMTVGGAIMGSAAESGSHRWGLFSDTCRAYELICGDGELLPLSRTENQEIYHAIPGSYGSLGLLVSAEIDLIPASPSVHLHYKEGLPIATDAPFIDGIVFDKDLCMQIEGNFTSEKARGKRWYFEEARKKGETILPLFDYLFRYDSGAFWMGAHLLKFSFLSQFITQGLLKFPSTPYSKKATPLPIPNRFLLSLMSSHRLWKLLHRAEGWIQNHLVIQDCCMPLSKIEPFLREIVEEPGIFPIWLCPIKNSQKTQLFAPHALTEPILNVGLYGLPAHSAPIENITKKIEMRTTAYGGRKVLYSRSFYTPEEFWKIYDHTLYRHLRQKTGAEGVWPDITDKVLST